MSFRGMQTFTMRIVNWDDVSAEAAKKLIADSFRARLNAYPNTNHKRYIVVEAQLGLQTVIVACASLSFAHEQSLFSENYLQSTLQNEIQEIGYENNRSTVCEIGSLSTNPAFIKSVNHVVAYFPWFAYRLGYKLALVTVTSYIRDALSEAGVKFEPICATNPERLSSQEVVKWGKYYDFEPQTGVISLEQMEFLDDVSTFGSRDGEMRITLGCFAKVEA